MRLGFRSKVLSELTQQLLGEGILDNEGNLSSSITYENLLKLRGIGPYSASHLMMLELDFSQIPIDSEVGSYCKLQHGIESSDISAFFNAWGDHKFLGYKLSRILSRTNRIE